MWQRTVQYPSSVQASVKKIHLNWAGKEKTRNGPHATKKENNEGDSMVKEKTLAIIKPDAVNRGLIGQIVNRFERKGLKIVAMKMEYIEEEKLKCHYEHHKDKAFFQELIEFMHSVPSVIFVLEGKQAVEVVRKMCGTTCGRDAEPGTIRGDFSISMQQNVIHASENAEAAKQEIERFFDKKELSDYRKMDFDFLYCKAEKVDK